MVTRENASPKGVESHASLLLSSVGAPLLMRMQPYVGAVDAPCNQRLIVGRSGRELAKCFFRTVELPRKVGGEALRICIHTLVA